MQRSLDYTDQVQQTANYNYVIALYEKEIEEHKKLVKETKVCSAQQFSNMLHCITTIERNETRNKAKTYGVGS